MKRFGKILSVLLIIIMLTLFISPKSAKAGETPRKYTYEEISQSIGYVVLTQDDAIKHVLSSFIIYKDEKYTYAITSYSANQEGLETELHYGATKIVPTLVGEDSITDISIYKFESNLYDAEPLHFSEAPLQEGQKIYFNGLLGLDDNKEPIYGNQTGYVAKNNIIYCDESKYLYRCLPLMQLDMYIYSIAHGGALVNEYGYVVGIPTYKSVDDEGKLKHATYSVDLINSINRIFNEEIDKRGDLGLYINTIESLSVDAQEALGTSLKQGTVITGVLGSVSKSGVGQNQIILAVNGIDVPTTSKLIREVRKYNKGTIIKLKVQKPNGNIYTYQFKI